jgi:protein-S-isoprenylcysteine O-methyltransferase Ste14
MECLRRVPWGLMRGLIVLPGTALVMIPAAILWVTEGSEIFTKLTNPGRLGFWLAFFVGGLGLALSSWTVWIFKRYGEGTPAPWDPPKKLVVRGPYRFVRNPMISGALLILLAEALFFQSWPIAAWMIVFFIGNCIYFQRIEEKGLEKRFGNDYLEYQAHVPRWIPRLRPWKPAPDEDCRRPGDGSSA